MYCSDEVIDNAENSLNKNNRTYAAQLVLQNIIPSPKGELKQKSLKKINNDNHRKPNIQSPLPEEEVIKLAKIIDDSNELKQF
jgi:hypothetical protein